MIPVEPILSWRFCHLYQWRLPLYVIETTHPTCRDFRKNKVVWVKDLNRGGMFDSFDFIGLEAGEEIINNDEGFIDFKVKLRSNENSGEYIKGQEIVICENSRFLRSGDPPGWLYASGEVKSEVAGLEDTILNN
jgi:SEC-C motif-containing protein